MNVRAGVPPHPSRARAVDLSARYEDSRGQNGFSKTSASRISLNFPRGFFSGTWWDRPRYIESTVY